MQINHLKVISAYWNMEASNYKKMHPEHLDQSLHPSWGLWHIPEKSLRIFEGASMKDKKILDLGCGQGHDAVAYAKLGAKVLAIDISREQIRNALFHSNVEYFVGAAENISVPDSSVNIAISDHGAFDHSPAEMLLKEMNRVLVVGGQLIICSYSPLAYVCYDENIDRFCTNLINSYPINTIKFDGEILTAQYSYSTWIKMFKEYDFSIDRLDEIIIPQDAREYFDDLVDVSWASKWPCDIIWSLRKIKNRR